MAADVAAACRDSSLRLGGFGDFLNPDLGLRPGAAAPGGSGRELDVVNAPLSAIADTSGAPQSLPEGPDPRR